LIHTGNGIRSILRPGTIPQYFDSFNGDKRNRVEIERVRTQPDRRLQRDYRSRVLSLTVNQDQRVIRAHATQLRRTHMIRCARVRLTGKIERRRQRLQQFAQLAAKRVRRGNVICADNVDWYHAIQWTTRIAARAYDDHFFGYFF
jgi:hypothetical protein